MTAHAFAEDRDACLNAGMNDYISKPIRMEDLHQAFERCPVKPKAEDDSSADEDSGLVNFQVLDELISMLGNDIDDIMRNKSTDKYLPPASQE